MRLQVVFDLTSSLQSDEGEDVAADRDQRRLNASKVQRITLGETGSNGTFDLAAGVDETPDISDRPLQKPAIAIANDPRMNWDLVGQSALDEAAYHGSVC